jgi:hypothetical protein
MLTVVDRPGYFGSKRAKKIEFYNNLFGEGNWSECWEVGGNIFSFQHAVALYDEAYYLHFVNNPGLIGFVCKYGECYDNDPSNVLCGLEHDSKANPRHIQDISVRRAMKRIGVKFSGPSDKLLQIRGEDSDGFLLNPGQVPFHIIDLILEGPLAGKVPKWAKPHSVEAFWQANKIIVIETVPLIL